MFGGGVVVKELSREAYERLLEEDERLVAEGLEPYRPLWGAPWQGVADDLARRIMHTSEFESILPSNEKLQLRYQVSYWTVRAAVKHLAEHDLVLLRARKPTLITRGLGPSGAELVNELSQEIVRLQRLRERWVFHLSDDDKHVAALKKQIDAERSAPCPNCGHVRAGLTDPTEGSNPTDASGQANDAGQAAGLEPAGGQTAPSGPPPAPGGSPAGGYVRAQ